MSFMTKILLRASNLRDESVGVKASGVVSVCDELYVILHLTILSAGHVSGKCNSFNRSFVVLKLYFTLRVLKWFRYCKRLVLFFRDARFVCIT